MGTNAIVISLAGELDLAKVAPAAEALEEAFAEEGAMVVVDLQELTFLDVKGITLLEELNRREGAGGRLRILPSRSLGVTRVLRTVGLDSMVKIVRD